MRNDEPEVTLSDGSPVTPDHRELRANGQQKGYVVLSEAERAKGFVRPVRLSYRHVGARPKFPVRDLTAAEKDQYAAYGYAKFEEYPEGHKGSVVGRFWTSAHLNGGCNSTTTMGLAIAETFARDNNFYGATMCVHCGAHFPLEQFVWEGTNEQVGS